MRELLSRKTENSKIPFVMESTEHNVCYSLCLQKESLLARKYLICSETDSEIAYINYKHILFEKANMPKLEIFFNNGTHVTVKKEIEQLCDTIKISGEDLAVNGDIYSKSFELLHKGKCIATFHWQGKRICVLTNNINEHLAIAIAFSIELAKY